MFTPRGTPREGQGNSQPRGSVSGPRSVPLPLKVKAAIWRRKAQISTIAPALSPDDPIGALIRQAWEEEGDLAYQRAKAVAKALRSAAKAYRAYKKNPDENSLTQYVNQVLKGCAGKKVFPIKPITNLEMEKPKKNTPYRINVHPATQKNIRKYLLEKIFWDWLGDDQTAWAKYFAYKIAEPREAEALLEDLLNDLFPPYLFDNDPILNRFHFHFGQEGEDIKATNTWVRDVIKAYVVERVEWERNNTNPALDFQKPYVDNMTRFYFLLSHEHHAQKLSHAKHSSRQVSPEHSKIKADDSAADTAIQDSPQQRPSLTAKPGTPRKTGGDENEVKYPAERRVSFLAVDNQTYIKSVLYQPGMIIPVREDMLPTYSRMIGWKRTIRWYFGCWGVSSCRRSAKVADSPTLGYHPLLRFNSSNDGGKQENPPNPSSDSPVISPREIFQKLKISTIDLSPAATPNTEGNAQKETGRKKTLAVPGLGHHKAIESVYNSFDFQLTVAVTAESPKDSGLPTP